MGRGTSHSRSIFILCVKVPIRRSGLSSWLSSKDRLGWRARKLGPYERPSSALSNQRDHNFCISSSSNGLVEHGHGPIVNSIAKYCDQPANWPKYLPLALWVDRITIRRSTGYSAFELLYG